MADRVLVLREGRAVASGPVGKLFDRPSDPYVAGLLASR
jgi:ABC-type dipeptide/oligopeptide/nickel transport system ATPase component